MSDSKNNPNHKKRGVKRWIRNPLKPIRMAVKEETGGGIIYRKIKGSIEILLIRDAKGRWTIPKGHVEQGERKHETALREIEEETGLKHLSIKDWLGKTKFNYRRGDSLILMTTHVYLIEAHTETTKLRAGDSEGITAVKWFPVKEALDLIEYENMSRLLLMALRKIRDGNR